MSGHTHAPVTATGAHRRRLVAVLCITLTVMVAEIVGALVSGSLALLADAGHMLTDATGLAVALGASWLATRPATPERTFGLQRAEILAALLNGVILAVVACTVTVEGIDRLSGPVEVHSGPMLAVALVGLAANLVGILLLRRGQRESLNVRGAYLEVMGDLLGSVAVVVAGMVIALTGFERADAIASILIGVMIAPRAVSLLREVVHVLLEGTPVDVDLDQVRTHMLALPGVREVHDLHAWTITSGQPVLTAHVVAAEDDFGVVHDLLDQLQECASEHFDVEHSTFQIEPPDHRGAERSVHS